LVILNGLSEFTPYIFAEGAERYVEFLKAVFDSEERGRSTASDGSIANRQPRFRHTPITINETSPRFRASSTDYLRRVRVRPTERDSWAGGQISRVVGSSMVGG
jgi:hypothetical protein